MPSAAPKLNPLPLQPWSTQAQHASKPKPGQRKYSTTQADTIRGDPVHPAIFNGDKTASDRNLQKKRAESRDQHEVNGAPAHRQSVPSIMPRATNRNHRKKGQNGGHSQQNTAAVKNRKRKADDDITAQPARRARSDSEQKPLFDERYLRASFGYPTREEYPGAPEGLFNDKVVAVFHDAAQKSMNLQTTFSTGPGGCSRCELSCQIPTVGRERAIGDGPSKRDAVKAAYVHLIIKLHKSGILSHLFPSQESGLGRETMEEEADAKTDIYNYCARFGLIPTFSTRSIQRIFRARGKKLVEVTIELPEQDIKVASRGTTLMAAEIAACVKFKQEAERWHSQHGEGEIVVQDAYALNATNAQDFIELCKIERMKFSLEIDITIAKDRHFGVTLHQAQAVLDEKTIGSPVVMATRKKAEAVAKLCAASELSKQNPDLIVKFRKAMELSGGRGVLRPLAPIDFPVDQDAILIMKDTMREVRLAGLPDVKEEVMPAAEPASARQVRYRPKLQPYQITARSEELKMRQQRYEEDPNLQELRQKRRDLPMNQYRAQVLDLIAGSTYSIIVGATGSGKTTQVPQILLEHAIAAGEGARCNIICTQPRRIAATSVGRRVAQERNEPLQDTVGYQVRFDSKLPKREGSITYCTTGILMQQLQHEPDEIMDNTTHLIVDEVHERDIIIDFLLILLKKVMEDRQKAGKSVPKVVLMSATLDTELFAGYFKQKSSDGTVQKCPSLSVPGRTFPVKEKYFDTIMDELQSTYNAHELRLLQQDRATVEYMNAERTFSKSRPTSANASAEAFAEASVDETEAVIDWKGQRTVGSDGELIASNEREDALVPINLVATTIAHITKTSDEGAILVFLPGLEEIAKVDELLRSYRPLGVDFTDKDKFKLFMLHSSIPATQTDVFNPAPSGCRKVILATNIAETSVTIPDVQYVVDTGKLREKRYDQVRRITRLLCTWVSKSNSKQRAGRAGRVQNGNYYALFSKARYESLRAIGLPEMLRSDLQEICLDIKAQAFKAPIRQFLADAIEPPSPAAVEASVQNLVALEALTEDERLTQLGRLLASLPVHPSLGKMIVLGILFRCLDPMLILGAAVSERSLFVTPIDKKREARRAQAAFIEGSDSDVVALLNAFRQMREVREQKGQSAAFSFANINFLHMGAFKTIHQTAEQIEEVLVESGLIARTLPRERYKFEMGDPSLNMNARNVGVIKALTLSGFHPNLAVSKGGPTFRTPGEKNALIHPSSYNHKRGGRSEDDHYERNQLFSYSTMSKSTDGNSIYLRDTTACSPLMAVLFGGRLKSQGAILEMDGWLPFYVQGGYGSAKTILEFRKAFDRLRTNAYQDLSARDAKNRGFLADDQAREIFAQGLVDVLDRDLKIGKTDSYRPKSDDKTWLRRVGGAGDRATSSNQSDNKNWPRRTGNGVDRPTNLNCVLRSV